MSLRLRLLVTVAVIAVAALAAADVAIYSALHSFLFDRVDQSLQAAAADSARPVQFDGSLTCVRPGSHFTSDPFARNPNQYAGLGSGTSGEPPPAPPNTSSTYFVAVRRAGATANAQQCPAYVGHHPYVPRLPAQITSSTSAAGQNPVAYLTASSVESGGPNFEVRVQSLLNGDQLIVAAPLTDTDSTLHRLLLIELGVTAVAVVLAIGAAWWLVRLGLRPLLDVEETAETIAAGDLRRRIPDENPRTEVGRLGRTLNMMLARIEAAFSARLASEARLRASEGRLRRFVADASHELRTPIAAISAYSELFERGAAENTEDLARVITGIRGETARMDRLVADLLTLARLDEGQPIEHVPVELVALCAESAQTAQTVGPAWPITLSAAVPVEVLGDSHRLRQAVDNLLANVRAHTPEGTHGRIDISAVGGEAVLIVSDDGPGLSEEQAARLFERFYRADPSRSRSRGGAGLGLSIVAAIAQAHGGWTAAKSSPGQGLSIEIHIPLATEVPPVGMPGAGQGTSA
jgi:two-component system, OmpR family, sensor kinase